MALTDNLVAYYKLDGNSNDSVGSNNGTDTSVSYSSSYGKINQGASFNGSSSFISLGSGVDSFSDGDKNWTVGMWVNIQAFNLLGSIITFGSRDRGIRVRNDGGNANKINFFINSGGLNYIDIYSSVLSTNTFQYLTFTRSGSTFTAYLNGVSIGSGSSSVSLETSNGNTLLGKEKINGRYLNGYIDEVGIWSRALSTDEVSQLYNSGAGLQYPFTTNKPSFFPFFNQYL